jgi:hypothetical protein
MLEIAVCRLQRKHDVCVCTRDFRVRNGNNDMGKRETDYPHTISFRVTDQTWRCIQKQIEGSNLTPHEWCRKAALDRLSADWGLSKSERLLFWHFVRAQYLFTQGFQLLADRNLLGEQWKQIRANAKNRTSELVNDVLAKGALRDGEG